MKPSAPPVVPTATASYGQDGHGIVLQLHSPVSGPLQTLTHNGLKVNVFGDVWKVSEAKSFDFCALAVVFSSFVSFHLLEVLIKFRQLRLVWRLSRSGVSCR